MNPQLKVKGDNMDQLEATQKCMYRLNGAISHYYTFCGTAKKNRQQRQDLLILLETSIRLDKKLHALEDTTHTNLLINYIGTAQ